MLVTELVFEAFLNCETKSYLYTKGEVGLQSGLCKWQKHTRNEYHRSASERLLSEMSEDECHRGTASQEALQQSRYRLIIDHEAESPEIQSRVHGLELAGPNAKGDVSAYRPVRFVPNEKLTTVDKLLLAFDALAVSHVLGDTPSVGWIIHGHRYSKTRVTLPGLLEKARGLLESLKTQRAQTSPPPLVLVHHCRACEFMSRCRRIAIDKDDLSLIPAIARAERKRLHGRGIITVNQLSYTFRPGRRATTVTRTNRHALRALAIRKQRVHVVGEPIVRIPGTPVYIDVEGDPDRDVYYLVGLRINNAARAVYQSFWADDDSEQRRMWASCVSALSKVSDPCLIHYGSYETRFFSHMKARYPDIGSATFLDELTSSAVNLLSVIYEHVFFPTYSNNLKDIARFLGFRWTRSEVSGLTALAWRSQWASTREPNLKRKLLTYNAEDCSALQKVADTISGLRRASNRGDDTSDVINVSSMKREFPQRFGPIEFVLPEFRQINEAAYWDYQRAKVYVRSNESLKRVQKQRAKRRSRTAIRPNKTVDVERGVPANCSRCGAARILRYGKHSQLVYDLRLSSGGIKRWVVRYQYHRYICWHCRTTFQRRALRSKFGDGLAAYAVYQVIELSIPQRVVGKAIRDLFGLPVGSSAINRFKEAAARQCRSTYLSILGRVARGDLVHVDETKVCIDGTDRYVWVFVNMEDVAFVYSDTREASTVREVLKDFRGVLVSDFYAGYEAVECAQQKCLIHLMRDLNEGLRKDPFNTEMAAIVTAFGRLLKPIVESVDRFGLKRRHLQKHKREVSRFYEALSKADYSTELAAATRRRFEKSWSKLFTFLDHDGVPWNNNNAEHAIKAFAKVRSVVGARSSAKGIQEYLVLLSVCETCKCKGVSFLEALQSPDGGAALLSQA